jgi:xylulokinase
MEVTMSKDLILGIDIGTTGTKCTCYQIDGKAVASAYTEYPTIIPYPGWAELDPQRWWDAVKANLQNCSKKQGLDTSRIAVIGISCTNAVVLVDDAGNPLYNAISHHDTRTREQVEWLKVHVGEQTILNSTKNRLAGGSFALPTIRWLIDKKPGIMEKCKSFLMPSGFIIQRLTGVLSINQSRADLTSMSNMLRNEWDVDICEKAEIPLRILPNIYAATDIVGIVTKKAAEETGLAEGTPVTAGTVDTVAATIGSGAVNIDDCAITLGSCARLCVIAKEPMNDKRLLNIRSAIPGQYIIVQSTDNAGISLKWCRNTFGDSVQKLPGEGVYSAMDKLADACAPCSNGVVYLPYLGGEKSPIWNSLARGVFFGIGTNSDLGSLIRSVLEGVAFSIKDCFSLVGETYKAKGAIPIGGGAAKSQIWCQILANVLDKPIIQLASNETETLGDMVIASQAVGMKGVSYDFWKKMAFKGNIIEPEPRIVEIYKRQFEIYKDLYLAVKPLFVKEHELLAMI